LADVAGSLVKNWPGIAKIHLWEMARDKLGSPLQLTVVRCWLKAGGYIHAGERLNGSPLWNPPTGEVV